MKILFTDIETIPQYEDIEKAPEGYRRRWGIYWDARNNWKKDGRNALDSYLADAGLSAEFGRVCTIGLGFEGAVAARTLKDEVALLTWFGETVTRRGCFIGGHSVRNFDIPFLIRRMLIHGLILPKQLKILGVKPWNMMVVDTNDMWGCGDWRYKIKLDLLCAILGIESPKEMSGTEASGVAELFYNGKFKVINEYCKADIGQTEKAYNILKEMESDEFS